MTPISSITEVQSTLSLSPESQQLKEAHKLFRTAESMSVNDLLAVAFQKMNERDQ